MSDWRDALSSLSTAGGQALLQHGGRVGTPLGIALAGAGTYGTGHLQRGRDEEQRQALITSGLAQLGPGVTSQQSGLMQTLPTGATSSDLEGLVKTIQRQRLSSAAKGWTPATPFGEVASTTIGEGGTLAEALSAERGLHPTERRDFGADTQALQDAIDLEPDPVKRAKLQALAGPVAREGSVAIPRFGGLMGLKPDKEKESPVYWRTTRDAAGNEIQVPYSRDKSGNLTKVPFAGGGDGLPGKIAAPQARQLEMIDGAEAAVSAFLNAAEAVQGASSTDVYTHAALYAAGRESDPQWLQYFTARGDAYNSLSKASISAGRSGGVALLKMIQQHFPKTLDLPSEAISKVRYQINPASSLEKIKQSILGVSAPTSPLAAALKESSAGLPKGVTITERRPNAAGVVMGLGTDGKFYKQTPKGWSAYAGR
jgi:hypothetical protein